MCHLLRTNGVYLARITLLVMHEQPKLMQLAPMKKAAKCQFGPSELLITARSAEGHV